MIRKTGGYIGEALGEVYGTRTNSRAKGKRSELAACDMLRRCGIFDAERGARNGVKSGADIYSPTLQAASVRVEVKNVLGMRLGNRLWRKACEQAMSDSVTEDHWFLLWRPCRGVWAVTAPTVFGWTTIVGEQSIKAWIADTILAAEKITEMTQ